VQLTHAGITKCTLADGSIVFQDTVCTVIPKPEVKTEPPIKTIPFKMDKTWFDAPSVVPHQVVCTKSGCECGAYYREFDSGLATAIADALYLDGSWHRLEQTLSEIKLSELRSPRYFELARERDEAACNILMSQKTLRMFGERALAELRTKKQHAETNGLDKPDECDAGNLDICEHTNDIALYNAWNNCLYYHSIFDQSPLTLRLVMVRLVYFSDSEPRSPFGRTNESIRKVPVIDLST